MKKNIFPKGWSEERVKKLISHYENQTEEEAVAEDEALFAKKPARKPGKGGKRVPRSGKHSATKLLVKTFSEASKLPPHEQNALAAWILAEIQSEKRWQERFVHTAEVLEKLAEEALKEHLEGKTEPLDIEKF